MANASFSTLYPHITHWVESLGWVEIGQDDYNSSWVRLLGEGGTEWESDDTHETLDQALHALETYLTEMMKDWE